MTSWKPNSERRRETDLQARDNAVHVGKGNLGGGLAAVDGDTAHVDLEEKRSGMDAADFDAAPGDALHFGDEAAADQRLERGGVDVDKQAESANESRPRQQSADTSTSGGVGLVERSFTAIGLPGRWQTK